MSESGRAKEIGRRRRSPRPQPVDWARLLSSDTPAGVLDEIADWLGDGTRELILESIRPSEVIADWQHPGQAASAGRRHSCLVRGEPAWQLTAALSGRGPSRAAIERAALALEAWRQAHAELGRAERRLAVRTRELDLIQLLGHRAAEARTPFELFDTMIATLQAGEDLDLALVVHEVEARREALAFLGRPVDDETLGELTRRGAGMLGWSAESLPAVRRLELDSFDAGRGTRVEFREDDVALLPVMRKESPVACMLVLPSRGAEEDRLRLMYSAVNQLSLHLDRILTVREAEAGRFRTILDSMPQAVFLADHRMNVVQANRSAKRILGELDPSARGSLAAVVERMGLAELIDEARRRGAAVARDDVRPDAEHVFAVTASHLAGDATELEGLVLVFADVTESRRLQEKLAQSERMSGLGQMISGIAHELNNPLTSIIGYSQLLRAADLDDALAKRIDIVERESKRCQKIVRNLLSFVRRREPERKLIDINDVVRSVSSLMGYQLRVDGIGLRSELSSTLTAIRADEHELQQVLVNLLANAQHAVRKRDGEGGEIVVRTAQEPDGSVRLEVQDDGTGIPEDLRSKIFDPLFTTKEEGTGTGLGLSLVYTILGAHGASIEAVPVTRGALFRIVLPPADKEADAGDERIAASEPPAVPRPGRILVVDDEEPLARMLCDALSQDGHRVAFVGDGATALERLGREPFDLVISDIKMPGMSGERLYRELRRLQPRLAERLLLTTGDTVSDEPDAIAARTGLELLHKPFDLERLRETVRARLARS